MKLNWDAAVDVQHNSTVIGGILRDSEGEEQMAFCNRLLSALSPALAEAMSLRKAMMLCKELGIPEMSFEGDC